MAKSTRSLSNASGCGDGIGRAVAPHAVRTSSATRIAPFVSPIRVERGEELGFALARGSSAQGRRVGELWRLFSLRFCCLGELLRDASTACELRREPRDE